jgi:hypothetical protein
MNVLGDLVPSTQGGRLLGAHVGYSRHVRNDLATKGINCALSVAERIRWAPLPMHVRARLVSSLLLPAALYGSPVGCIAMSSLNSLTSSIMRAIWGTTRKLRCRDIVLTLFVQGHLVDPRQAIVYQALGALRRNLKKHPELDELLRNCWHACTCEGVDAPGPIGIVRKHLQRLGWRWHDPDDIEMHGGFRLPLLLGPDSWWHHQLRAGLRRHLWSEAASRRGDMNGLQAEQGLDRKATMALLDHRKLPAADVGMLRSVLSGFGCRGVCMKQKLVIPLSVASAARVRKQCDVVTGSAQGGPTSVAYLIYPARRYPVCGRHAQLTVAYLLRMHG